MMKQNSKTISKCQISGSGDLKSIMFLGYLPPPTEMKKINGKIKEESFYPADLMYSRTSKLVQLNTIVNKEILFPKDYAYTSSTTKILRKNFQELYNECKKIVKISSKDLVIDIGSNDGNLLSNFKNFHKVSPIYIKKRYASVDLPIWVAVAISNQEWLTCVQPSNMYKFHLWFNDVAMQFAIKNRKMVIDTELFVYNNQFIKTNYNFEKCSVTAGKNDKLNQVEQYGPHLIAFKERWGFDYESPSDDFETVRSRYKGTYVEKLYDHDCRKGPLISYD